MSATSPPEPVPARRALTRAGATLTRSVPLRWTVQHAAPHLLLRRAARSGDLGARLASDRSTWADPFPWYDALRAAGPLVPGRLVTATASHEVASEVLRSPVFRVGLSAESWPAWVLALLAATVDPRAVGPVEPPSMLAVDPPAHTRYRRLVAKVFTPRAVAALEPAVERLAHDLLDRLPPYGSFDLVTHYAAPLPLTVIAEILGVPEHMRGRLLHWGNAAAVTLDPALGYRRFRTATRALREMHRWLDGHLAELRRSPGPNLLSQLAAVEEDGERLDEVELRATALLVLGAGFETTVNLLGNAVVLLLAHPDQLDGLRGADPAGWANAVDEVLRFDSPVQATLRHAGADTQVAGGTVRRGQLVSVMLGGANRDPDVFADPHRFDVTRANARDHLAFSAGIHYCLGASLARLEGQVGLRALVDRFPRLAPAGTPVRRPLRVLRGFEHLPVRAGPQGGVSSPGSRSAGRTGAASPAR